jgi:hypothetical protein
MLITGYQQAYGTLYTHTTDLFESPYAGDVEFLLPGLVPRSQLYSEGKLPQYALFNPVPPDPSYADITPATQPAFFAPVFALGLGNGNLLTNDFRARYLADAQVSPDGGWPVITTGTPAASSRVGLRQALIQNDLRTWSPAAPTLLCGGDGDPQVFWFNTQLMQNYWNTREPAVTGFSVLDLDAPAAATDPYGIWKVGFSAAKLAVAALAIQQGASDGGTAAVFEAYHATLVAPFCLAAVYAFFAAH